MSRRGVWTTKIPSQIESLQRSSYLLERHHCWNRKRFGATTIGSTSIQRRIVDASYICTGKAWHVPNHLFGAKHVHSLDHTFHDWTCFDMVFWTSPNFICRINSASIDWQCIKKWTSCFLNPFPPLLNLSAGNSWAFSDALEVVAVLWPLGLKNFGLQMKLSSAERYAHASILGRGGN